MSARRFLGVFAVLCAEKASTYTCQNCNFTTTDRDQLLPIKDIHQRVEPGERMPAGECPECGALVHLED